MSKAKAVMAETPGMLVRISEPLGEVGIGLNLLEDRRLDRRDLAFDLFEALRIVAFQQRRGKDLATILAAVRSFTRASRAR